MERLSFVDMISRLNKARESVLIDSEYRHVKSDHIYVVADIVFREEDMELLVVYYDPYQEENISFTRPLDEFLSKFEWLPG